MTPLSALHLDDPQMLALSDASLMAHVRCFFFLDKRAAGNVMTSTELSRCYVRPAQRKDLIQRGVWGEAQDGGAVVRGFDQHDTTGTEVQSGDQGASNGVEVHRALSGAERTRRWREKITTVTDVTKAPSQNVTENQVGDENEGGCDEPDVTKSSAPPDPPQIHDLDLKSSPDLDSSSVLASDPNLLGSARDSEPRARKRTIEKPVPMTWDFRPPQKAWEVTRTKLECCDEDFERHLPDFRHYWIDGKGAGKSRTPRGWVQAWMGRMTWLAERGQLHKPPGAVQHEKTRQEEARRPYHELFKAEPAEPKASPAEALAAIQRATAGIGRRIG